MGSEMCIRDSPEAVKSHGTHVVALPEDDKHGMSADDEDHSTLETKQEEETSSDEDQEHVLKAFGTHHLNPRSRAAPIYNELLPGWRARARDLTSSYHRTPIRPDADGVPVQSSPARRRSFQSAQDKIPVDMDSSGVPVLGTLDPQEGGRSSRGGGGESETTSG